ncbi:MAG: CYTH domain-containing protein [Paludibacteraceae bacterium]|nr:CYTH domain-containing protein [Paludibacteraceae bacterium]
MSCPNNIEIERKFLVRDDSYKTLATSSIHIRQGYLSRSANCTVRVRVVEQSGFLTIKSAPAANGFAHYEFEKEITVQEANELLQLALPGIIDKRRWLVPIHSLPSREESEVGSQLVCEVDEFFGDNAGLVMAEVELPTEDTPFVHPDFLGDEVTFDKRYYNSYLSQHPFTTW